MKEAIVEYSYNQGYHKAIVIRNLDHLAKYFDYIGERMSAYVTRLMKAKTPADRLNHYVTKTPEGACLAAAWMKCLVTGDSPMIEMCNHFDRQRNAMFDAVMRGDVLVVNKVGGYFPLKDPTDVIDEWDFIPEREFTHTINENTKYINLENDDELEEHTKKYLGAIDPNFSYIQNLHSYSKDELVQVFTEFKEKGGDTVYVYTTGLNVQQMYEYTDAAIRAGIMKFEFEFNSGLTDGIVDYTEFMETLPGVTFNVIK